MVWYEIALLILAGALLLVVFVVYVRHIRQIAAIQVREISDEKQRQVKAIMAEQRLFRKLNKISKVLLQPFKPLLSLLKTMAARWADKIKALEEQYKIERLTTKSVTEKGQESLQQRLQQLFKTAQEHMKQEAYQQAEETYITVIKLDPQSIDAFLGLGEVYAQQKKYNQSLEVYQYILKMLQDQKVSEIHLRAVQSKDGVQDAEKVVASMRARVMYEMSHVQQFLGKEKTAYHLLKQVVDNEPANPKYLDALLNMSIMKKDQKIAQDTFSKLKNTNPDNKKLKDFEKQIASLSQEGTQK